MDFIKNMETVDLKQRIAQGENTTTEFKENFDQKEYVEINNVSRRIAYEELRDMTDKGLLSMIGKGRGSRYVQKLRD